MEKCCKKCSCPVPYKGSVVKEFKCPSCGGIYLPYRVMKDMVILWPLEVEKVTPGGIIIPDQVHSMMKDPHGIVLGCGPGYHNKHLDKFIPMVLRVGQKVLYDTQVPWNIDVVGLSGVSYTLPLMGMQDVKAVVED